MKLDFVKVGGLVCPTLSQSGIASGNQELIENVIKCTVTSALEQETVMTLTVSIPVADVTQTNKVYAHDIDARGVITEWECTQSALPTCPQDTHSKPCTHVGSKPRLCAKDRGKTATWRLKNDG